jgi:hypothetical protein
MQVAFELGTYYVHCRKICIDKGENSRQVSSNTGRRAHKDVQLTQTKAIGAGAYEEKIRALLLHFLNKHVLSKHKREDIRAIIISGEASTTAENKLGDTALELVGTGEVKLMKEIDSSEVVAYGAVV